MRIVQLTPHGSACSIVAGAGIKGADAAPVHGLHLVVDDVEMAHRQLIANGINVSEVQDLGGGVRHAHFSDPDADSWVLQQLSSRLPPRP